jgi:hypothetical protein
LPESCSVADRSERGTDERSFAVGAWISCVISAFHPGKHWRLNNADGKKFRLTFGHIAATSCAVIAVAAQLAS